MAVQNKVSLPVIKRLPKYYRYLTNLSADGKDKISSSELAHMMGTTASQVRQDFNCFGGFGQQGYGYSVEQLYDEIENILGLQGRHKTVLIGAGNLGRAVATHMSFETRGFELIGIFDRDKTLIGQEIREVLVGDIKNLEQFCELFRPEVAILCVPKSSVEPIAKILYASGIKNYWNFSHYDLSVAYDDVIVENVHMSDSLMTLCYRINAAQQQANIEP